MVLAGVYHRAAADHLYSRTGDMDTEYCDGKRHLRVRAKIFSHFKRRCIPPDCVVKTRNMLDIPAFSRLVSRAPQHLKLQLIFARTLSGGQRWWDTI